VPATRSIEDGSESAEAPPHQRHADALRYGLSECCTCLVVSLQIVAGRFCASLLRSTPDEPPALPILCLAITADRLCIQIVQSDRLHHQAGMIHHHHMRMHDADMERGICGRSSSSIRSCKQLQRLQGRNTGCARVLGFTITFSSEAFGPMQRQVPGLRGSHGRNEPGVPLLPHLNRQV